MTPLDPDPRVPDDWPYPPEPEPRSGAIVVYIVGAAAIVLGLLVAVVVMTR